MSWDCPHQKKDECVRLRKPCQPLRKGCALEGKVTFIDNQLDSEYKMNLKKETIRRSYEKRPYSRNI